MVNRSDSVPKGRNFVVGRPWAKLSEDGGVGVGVGVGNRRQTVGERSERGFP